MQKVSSGCAVIDDLLQGGFETGTISAVYGPAGTGKTTLCMQTAIRMAGSGKKIIYIDSESSFSIERVIQITRHYSKALQNIIFFRPKSFNEQHEIFENLSKIINSKIGLIVVDTIATLYRLERKPELNKALSRQMTILLSIAHKHNIPILVTNQVYTDFEDGKIKMSGGTMIKRCSKCLIELKKVDNERASVLVKHRDLSLQAIPFQINDKGIQPISQ